MPPKANVTHALEELLNTFSSIDLLNTYQYQAPVQHHIEMPSNIRLHLRQRKASLLGKTVHHQFTLAFALKTSAHVILNQTKISLKAGEALLVFPGQIHHYENIVSDDVHWVFCGFHLSNIEHYQRLKNKPIPLTSQILHDLHACLDLCLNHYVEEKRKISGSDHQVALRVKLILDQLRTIRDTQMIGTEDIDLSDHDFPLIRKTCEYICEHIEEPINIQDIADHLHVSSGHLRNEFSKRIQSSLGRYIRYMKMHNACVLMDTTNQTLASIGERCGYPTLFSFSRAFKKEKGIAPSEYRKNFNGNIT